MSLKTECCRDANFVVTDGHRRDQKRDTMKLSGLQCLSWRKLLYSLLQNIEKNDKC